MVAAAKAEFQQALRARPGGAHFLGLLGEAERKLGHPDSCLAFQQNAIAGPELSIKSAYFAPELYLTLGSLYAQRKRFREAEDLCRKAIALDVSGSEGFLETSRSSSTPQRLSDKALSALRQALPEGKSFGSSPYDQQLQAVIHFEFRRTYEAKGAAREAIHGYEQCLAFDSGRAAAHRRLAELYNTQGCGAPSGPPSEIDRSEAVRLLWTRIRELFSSCFPQRVGVGWRGSEGGEMGFTERLAGRKSASNLRRCMGLDRSPGRKKAGFVSLRGSACLFGGRGLWYSISMAWVRAALRWADSR